MTSVDTDIDCANKAQKLAQHDAVTDVIQQAENNTVLVNNVATVSVTNDVNEVTDDNFGDASTLLSQPGQGINDLCTDGLSCTNQTSPGVPVADGSGEHWPTISCATSEMTSLLLPHNDDFRLASDADRGPSSTKSDSLTSDIVCVSAFSVDDLSEHHEISADSGVVIAHECPSAGELYAASDTAGSKAPITVSQDDVATTSQDNNGKEELLLPPEDADILNNSTTDPQASQEVISNDDNSAAVSLAVNVTNEPAAVSKYVSSLNPSSPVDKECVSSVMTTEHQMVACCTDSVADSERSIVMIDTLTDGGDATRADGVKGNSGSVTATDNVAGSNEVDTAVDIEPEMNTDVTEVGCDTIPSKDGIVSDSRQHLAEVAEMPNKPDERSESTGTNISPNVSSIQCVTEQQGVQETDSTSARGHTTDKAVGDYTSMHQESEASIEDSVKPNSDYDASHLSFCVHLATDVLKSDPTNSALGFDAIDPDQSNHDAESATVVGTPSVSEDVNERSGKAVEQSSIGVEIQDPDTEVDRTESSSHNCTTLSSVCTTERLQSASEAQLTESSSTDLADLSVEIEGKVSTSNGSTATDHQVATVNTQSEQTAKTTPCPNSTSNCRNDDITPSKDVQVDITKHVASNMLLDYITSTTVNSSSFDSQPLLQLANLVQKVSVTSSELHGCMSRRTESTSDAPSCAAYHRSQSAFPSSHQLSLTADGDETEFKKPSPRRVRKAGARRRTNEVDKQVECLTDDKVSAHTVNCDVTATPIGTSLDDNTLSSPDAKKAQTSCKKVKPVRDATAKSQNVPTSSRSKSRVRKCKVDVVDVKFLKDLITAVTVDGLPGSTCDLVTSSASAADTVGVMAPDKTNTTNFNDHHTKPATLKSKQSPVKQRKNNSTSRKTTKILNDITLIDVAAVKSCVEKDYSEFIRCMNETADNAEMKSAKKKQETVKTSSNSAVEGDVKPKKRLSKKTRSKEISACEQQSTVTQVSERTRSGRKKQHRFGDNAAMSQVEDNLRELSPVVSDFSTATNTTPLSPDQLPQDTLPNEISPTSKKKGRQRKKKIELETEECGTENIIEVRHSRNSGKSKRRHSLQSSQVDEPSESNAESSEHHLPNLNACVVENVTGTSDADVQSVAVKSRGKRKSKKKLVSTCATDTTEMKGTHDPVDSQSVTESNTYTTVRPSKRKSQRQSGVTDDVTSEPARKKSKKKATPPEAQCLQTSKSMDTDANTSLATSVVNDNSTPSCIAKDVTPDTKQTDVKSRGRKTIGKKKKKKNLESDAGLTIAADTEPVDNSEASHPPGNAAVCNDEQIGEVLQGVKNNDPVSKANMPTLCEETPAIITHSSLRATDTEGKLSDELNTCEEVGSQALIAGEARSGPAAGSDADDADMTKTFACSQCSYRAQKKGQLRKHLSVHKLFNCAHCEFSASSQSDLDNHMSIKHPSRCGRRLCKRCHMLYRAGPEFLAHVEQCTGEKLAWYCPTCGKEFKFISAMRTHIRRWHTATSDQSTDDDKTPGSQSDNAQVVTALLDQVHAAMISSVVTTSTSSTVIQSAAVPVSSNSSPSPCVSAAMALTTVTGLSVTCTSSLSATSICSTVSYKAPELTTYSSSMQTSLETIPAISGMTVPTSLEPCDKPMVSADVTAPRATDLAPTPSILDSTANRQSSTTDANGEVRYMCDHCSKSFKAKRSMVHHRRMIHEGGRLKKKEAAMMATTSGQANEKVEDESVNGTEAVSTVTASVTDSPAVLASPAVDSCPTVYTCSFADCSRTFKRPGLLHKHEEKHVGPDDRRHACDWPDCRKAFLHIDNLAAHRRHHTEPKPFSCPQCSLGYWQKSSLHSHLLKIHGATRTETGSVSTVGPPTGTETDMASRLVDGIIKSVSASLQSGTRTPKPDGVGLDGSTPTTVGCCDIPVSLGGSGDVVPPLSVEGVAECQRTSTLNINDTTSAVDILDKVVCEIAVEDKVVGETKECFETPVSLVDVAVCRSVATVSAPASNTVVTSSAQCHSEVNDRRDMLSQPLNVYEFAEDETVSICRPKPSRAITSSSRTSIESSQGNIESNNDNVDDDDEHDLSTFDDDILTVDRLAETVITYSRKKKPTSTEKSAALRAPSVLSELFSGDGEDTVGKKSKKRGKSAGGRKRYEPSAGELTGARKRKIRRQEAVSDETDPIGTVKKPCKQPRTSVGSGRKSKKLKSDGISASGSKKSSSNDLSGVQQPGSSSDTASKNSQAPLSTSDELVTEDLDSGKVGDGEADTAKSVLVENKSSRKRKDRKSHATLASPSVKIADDDVAKSADAPSQLDINTDPVANSLPGTQFDDAPCSTNVGTDDPQLTAEEQLDDTAGDYLSDNTEILSLHDNSPHDNRLHDNSLHDDDVEVMRRSSPASYKSEEHESRVGVPRQPDHDNDNSRCSLAEEASVAEQTAASDDGATNSLSYDLDVMSLAASDAHAAVLTYSLHAAADDDVSRSHDHGDVIETEYTRTSLNNLPQSIPGYSQPPSTESVISRFSPMMGNTQMAGNSEMGDYGQRQSVTEMSTEASYDSSASRSFYAQLQQQDRSTAQQLNSALELGLSMSSTAQVSNGLAYTPDAPAGSYPLLPVRSDPHPIQALDGLAAESSSYMSSIVGTSAYVEPQRSSLIDASTSSYSMSLPPYPNADQSQLVNRINDQSQLVNRIPAYLPYANRNMVETPHSAESAAVYGRSMHPTFPSDAFTKEFFGQYLHESSSTPLHPLATHGALHDQHAAAAAGLLGGYQQAAQLPAMPHSGSGSELLRRAYSGVSDNLLGGMKSGQPMGLGTGSMQLGSGSGQAEHWMSGNSDAARQWNHSSLSSSGLHADVPRYTYPVGRPDPVEPAKTLQPMTKRSDDLSSMFAAMSSASSTVQYPLSGTVYSPPGAGPPTYPHPSLPSAVSPSHRQLEDAYRQMAGDYRSLAHHRTPSEMYGSALSSLDRYYYTARDAMYRSQQLAAAAMPHPFMPQTTISSQYPDRAPGYGRDALGTYGQCPPPPPSYGLMCPRDKQYLPPSTSAMRSAGDYLDTNMVQSQEAYNRHSVIYNMVPRYF